MATAFPRGSVRVIAEVAERPEVAEIASEAELLPRDLRDDAGDATGTARGTNRPARRPGSHSPLGAPYRALLHCATESPANLRAV